jgi:F420-dependent oxidoreductase-like protein
MARLAVVTKGDRVRFGLDVSQHQLYWDDLLERVNYAEREGFECAWLFDHFKVLYGDPGGPCFEAWAAMAGLAAATENIRIGPLVSGVTYRHPSLLAAEAVTIDHISNGRLELAVGAAWFQEEHEELGFDFPSNGGRIRRLEEAAQVLKLLMTDDGVSFDGRYYTLDNATYNPKPVQKPHPPLWIGGSGEKLTLPVVGRWADAWHAGGSVASLKRKSAIVDRAAEEAGRDPANILRASYLSLSEPWDEVRANVEGLRDIGFSYLVVSWPSEGKERLEEFVSNVMPEFTD